MPRTRTSSYHSFLLASVAGVATLAALNGTARAADITVSTQQSGATTLETLAGGDNLSVTSTGGLTITVGATGTEPAVFTGAMGVGSILNSGTIGSDETVGGIAVYVPGAASLNALTNNAGGLIQATGSNQSSAIFNVGGIGTITNNTGALLQSTGQSDFAIYNYNGSIAAIVNSGLAQATGAYSGAIDNQGGSIGSITNSAGGVIQATNVNSYAIQNGSGTVGLITNNAGGVIQTTGTGDDAIINWDALAGIANSGTIQSSGNNSYGIVSNSGTMGLVTNAAGGLIQDTGSSGNAIANWGTMAGLTNSGLIQATGSNGTAIYNSSGTIGVITNEAGGVIQATGDYGPAISNQSTLVSISNAGLIGASGLNARAINNDYAWIGSVANVTGGVIQATGNYGAAIFNGGYAWMGSVSNATGAVIQATGANSGAIYNGSYSWMGSVTNAAGGVIQATGDSDIAIANYGTLAGIDNSGTIQATGSNGVAIYSSGYGWTGTITNEVGGVIQATGTSGVAMRTDGTLYGIANSGLIQATGPGGIAIANNLNSYDYLGTVTNNLGGIIQATGTGGIAIQNNDRMIGLVNSGLIQATGTSGIAIENNASLGGISNTGTIRSTLGTAILLGSGGTITNGITNAAGALIQGGPASGSGTAIDASAATSPLSITTGGTIIGAIRQGSGGDRLTVTGGAIVGTVLGQSGSGGSVDFALGSGGFSTGGNITDVDTVTLSSGLLVMAPGGGISGAQTFTIASDATARLGTNLAAGTTTNNGVLDVGTNAPTLTGNYVQSSSGSLAITANGAAVGELKVTGSAVVQPGAHTVALHFTGAGNYTNLPTPLTVLYATGGLTFSGGASASSDSANPYYQTVIVSDPVYSLTITFAPPTQAALQAYAASFMPAGSTPYLSAARSAYGARLAGLTESSYNDMLAVLAGLSASQVQALEQQAAPRSIASAAADLANGLGANTALSLAITTRQMELHGLEQDPAGHPTGAWVQPLGSTATQSGKDGFDGFSAGTYGIAFGADTRVTPDVRVGVAIALAESDINYAGAASGNSDKMQSGQVGIYGTFYRHGFFVDAGLTGGFNRYDSTQNITVLGRQTGSYPGGQVTAQADTGYDFHVDGAVITPGIGLRELHMSFGDYTMAGLSGPSAHIDGEELNLVQGRAGAQIAFPWAPRPGWHLTPMAHAYLLHNFDRPGVTTVGTFSNGLPFALTAPSTDANLVEVGAGVTASRGGPFSLAATYQFTGGATTSNNTFALNLKAAF